MPDISKQEAVIKGLKNQTHRLLDLSLDSHKVTTGERIPRAGKDPELVILQSSLRSSMLHPPSFCLSENSSLDDMSNINNMDDLKPG